ncbi:MAG: IS5 family transposase [Ghiorsea sp.]|nr:IS5 family transposase [Ghiorsea sp.]
MAAKVEIKKTPQKHKVTNWSHYNNSLKRRGSLELWISSEMEELWYEADRVNDGTGTPREYTDRSIRLAYELKLTFKQPLRQLQGFINSLFKLASLNIKCPDYTTVSRRCKTLDLKMPIVPKCVPDDSKEKIITIDSTGLKQYGKDEWHQEKHNVNPRRTWRKIHLAVDENHMIRASLLTEKSTHDSEVVPELLDQIDTPAKRYIGDGAYDTKDTYNAIEKHSPGAKIVIPPRDNAVDSELWHSERNKTLEIIDKHERGGWCRMRKYGKQSYAELAMQRYKRIIGNRMHSKDIERQKNEAIIGASILNKFTAIGMPISIRVA